MSRRTLLAIWATAILLLLVGTTMPGSVKSGIEAHLWSGWSWSTYAHFILFAVISGIPVYGDERWWIWRSLAFALFLAVLTECLQNFVPGRHMRLHDGVVDLAGATSGMLASSLVGRRRSLRQAGFGRQD